jgi:hypothetical protein
LAHNEETIADLDNVKYGGYGTDEDESMEWKVTSRVTSKAVKLEGKKKVTYFILYFAELTYTLNILPQETLVIIPNAPADQLKHSVPIQNATTPLSHATFTNIDLPAGTQNCFWDVLSPMFHDYIGTLPNSWEATTHEATVHELQAIWDIVFPILHTQSPSTMIQFSIL